MSVGVVSTSDLNSVNTEMVSKPTESLNSTDMRITEIAATEMANKESSPRPSEEAEGLMTRAFRGECNFCCAFITGVAFTTCVFVSWTQANRILRLAYQEFDDQRAAMRSDANAIATLQTEYDARNTYLLEHYAPLIATGVLSLACTPMYINTLQEGNSKVSRVGLTILGAGTIVAGGIATVAGLSVGGPIMIAVGATTVLTGVSPPNKVLQIRRKIDKVICSALSKLRSCFRSSNSEI